MREAVRRLGVRAADLGCIATNPLSAVGDVEWSPNWETNLLEEARLLSRACLAVESAVGALSEAVGIRIAARGFQRLDAVEEFAGLLGDCWRKHGAFALEGDGPERIDALEEAVARLKTYARLQSELSCPYEEFAWRRIDGARLSVRWREAASTWWPKSVFAKRSLLKELARDGANGIPDPIQDAPILEALRQEGTAIDQLDRKLASLGEWRSHGTDPAVAETLKELGLRVRRTVGRLAEDGESLLEIRSRTRTLLEEGNDLLAPEASVGRASKALLDSFDDLSASLARMDLLCGQSIRERFASSADPLGDVGHACEGIIANRTGLKDWCAWREARSKALELGLGPLVASVEEGTTPPAESLRTFDASYCTWWSRAVIGEDRVLRTFSATEQNDAVRRFRELDSHFQELTAACITARLCASIPGQDGVSRSSGWGVLRHELQKKIRHKPVRQLVREIPDVLSTLAPCLMMSPLSVAQYLPADRPPFDLVIFDEASQITVWDAVGSLARGRQVVVAGDPRQMPPTNFFARSGEEEDDDIDQGDLESILDELDGASIPRRTLNLHYRSRRESLIAFSNNRYYDGTLVTFPAPVAADRGIRLVRPQGFYARGGARHNEGEAKAIVAEIVRRLQDPDPKVRNASVGVVTFNSEQQKLIEDLLDDARSRNPDMEWAFSGESVPETVFVKNLETVQGDERDVILFSVTYGPDQGGAMTMNFGPLNRTGGERRLNVALTRARSELVVFSTLSPDNIDLSRTQARAVTDLKHFLEYAERGPSALGGSSRGSGGELESPFEEAVAARLERKGWKVRPQVGVSSFRIDMGIVHPDFPGIYLAGIECDGATYHSSAFARERDKIRHQVLEGLGWKLLRIWSTHWWNNPAGCTDSIHTALSDLLDRDRKERSAKAGEELEPPPAGKSASANAANAIQPSSPVSTGSVPGREARTAKEPSISFAHQVAAPVPAPTEPLPKPDLEFARYRAADLEKAGCPADPARFHSPDYAPRLKEMVEHVVDVEGPVHEDVLVRRIARHHGFQRAGSLIRSAVVDLARQSRVATNESVGTFFWPESTGPEHPPVRFRDRDEEMRNADLICREEIQAIASRLDLSTDPVELSRALGISRLAKGTKARLCVALGLPADG